ncbi:MAG TPA: helix-turn-helix transcriptional regulator [Thermoanaerobacterales bacterium]|nr:helix-turn-helix transcriptional regulator [Thermoanaerobacterales bacterium]
MTEKSGKIKEATCEIEVAFNVIGGKWKPLILWFLGESGTLRFGELQHLIPDITHRILTKQLRELEMYQLVQRKVYPEVPVRVEYSITEKGREVIPILDMMCEWAYKNNFFGYRMKYNLCE